MRVLHIINSINEGVGGPAYSVPLLISSLAELGVEVDLLTLDYPERGPIPEIKNCNVHSFPISRVGRYLGGFDLASTRSLFVDLARKADLIHNHGVWLFQNWLARIASQYYDKPLITSPRGMLEEWSMKNGSVLKQLMWPLVERGNLKSASAFHATSEQEAQSIRRLGFNQNIIVIPNPISSMTKKLNESEHSDILSKRTILFLSRVHPKKGVDMLIRAWLSLEGLFPDWQLVVAGEGEEGYMSQLRVLAREQNVASRISFTGHVSGEQKKIAFQNAGLFVLPSYSENFGVSVAEALSYGIPVITTRGTPWECLNIEGCGWWVNAEEGEICAALMEALSLSDIGRFRMGQIGRDLVLKRFDPAVIAKQMQESYEQILIGREQF